MTARSSPPHQDSVELASSRTILVRGNIDEQSANTILAKMLFLFDKSRETPVTLDIDSPGGLVTPGLAIIDLIRERGAATRTVCSGRASGVAAAIFACGAPGKRWIARAASIYLGPLQSASVAAGGSDESRRLEASFVTTLARCTGHDEAEIRRDVHAGRELDAAAAIAYGLADAMY